MKAKITKRLVDMLMAEIVDGGLAVDRTVFDTVDLGFVLRVRKSGGSPSPSSTRPGEAAARRRNG